MSVHRGDSCAATLDGKIYIFGGFSDLNFCAPLTSLEVYDPVSNTWTDLEASTTPRGDAACGTNEML